LQPGGGPGQATHKVSLRDAGEVDAEIVQLLRVAYEQNAWPGCPLVSTTVAYAAEKHLAIFA
jgi:hypothetical protein